MLANIVVEKFIEGGWVMWPILATFFLALCVILDRMVWWSRLYASLQNEKQEQARNAIGTGDFNIAWELTKKNGDPYLKNLAEGMTHAHTSMLAAMQLHATRIIEHSEARMWVLSTLITLAPLLGLFGTVVGIMGSFSFIGDEQLAASKVSGGIGEALIATACGIAIAILCLLPYNFFRKRVSVLRGSLERWINHTELLVKSAKEHGHDLEIFAANQAKR
ncbi:MAG: MotA/TolQ/ExbB proton channel family protein [Akkermansiaceae bacterium]|jgi:biopolymer transport protein ExbB|nr:MotA/TolQ/ExbB proton channel family protein [Akkermansiaceae bacterium]MBJ7285673.1 MotA/TolQ/ExbB proton channel family protein [Akkermansiaceae bacterium]MBJ7396592.1 MotA/TolQ/ExbB proton channel family protein [Akkermansiaceae bacterium]